MAIELAAAQTRVETVDELAATLDERLPTLATAARDVPDRQRTMEAAIGWSLQSLQPDAHRAFNRLAVFAGGFDPRGAAVVLHRNRADTVALVGDLLDRSLLVRQPSAGGRARFRMLEPLRAVAAAAADGAERAEAAAAHVAFVDDLVERLAPAGIGIRRADDLAELRREHPNLMAALQHLAETDPDRCVQLTTRLSDYWSWTRREFEARRLVNRLLEDGSLSDRTTCLALLVVADADLLAAEHVQAQRSIDAALSLAERIGDDAVCATVRSNEAGLARYTGDLARARRAADAALMHARRTQDAAQIAWALLQTPVMGALRPDAHDRQEEALHIARERSMATVEYRALLMLGVLNAFGGSIAEAEELTRSALGIARRFDAPEEAAWAEINLADILVTSERAEEARVLLLAALAAVDRVGHRMESIYALRGLAQTEVVSGRPGNGLALFAAARAIAERMQLSGPLVERDHWERALYERAEKELSAEPAAARLARGARMSYREAVDFAFEIHGVSRGSIS